MTGVVDRWADRAGSPLAASLVALGWLPAALSLVAVVTAEGTQSPVFLVALSLAVLMVVLGPFDVWYYDERIFPEFAEEVGTVVVPEDRERAEGIVRECESLFVRQNWLTVVAWTALILAVVLASQEYLASQGIGRPDSISFWAFIGFVLFWTYVTGLGVHAGVVTGVCVGRLADSVDFRIDPLHPDGHCGLSVVGDFAIRTTLIISSGSLALPLGIQFATHSGHGELVFVGVATFLGVLALVFLYPTFKTRRQAGRRREEILDEYRREIRDLESRIAGADTDEQELALELEIQRIRREFEDYRDVKLYPLSVSILTRFVSSLLLPLVFLVFEIYLDSLL